MSMFWLFGLGEGVRVNPNIVRIVMHIGIYGRSLTKKKEVSDLCRANVMVSSLTAPSI